MPKSYLGHPVDFLNSGVTSKLTCLFHGLITISVTPQLLQYINDEEGTSFFHDLFYTTVINLGAQIRGAQTRYTGANFGLTQPLFLFDYGNI